LSEKQQYLLRAPSGNRNVSLVCGFARVLLRSCLQTSDTARHDSGTKEANIGKGIAKKRDLTAGKHTFKQEGLLMHLDERLCPCGTD
jgi:hypothetical protein